MIFATILVETKIRNVYQKMQKPQKLQKPEIKQHD